MIDPVNQSQSQTSIAGRVWSRSAPYLAVTLGYLFLASLAFPSIIFNLSTAIPGIKGGNPDFALFYWDLWWFKHAVFRLGQNPFYTNYILYPHTLNLAYHTFAPLFDIVSLPLYQWFGPTVATNGFMIVSLPLSGLAMWAFLRHHHVSAGLAFVGGLLFIFSSFTAARISMSHVNMLPIGWLPMSLLAWDWLVERRTIAAAIVLSGVLYAAFMTDSQFGLWLALLLIPYALFRLITADRRWRFRIVALSGLTVLILLGFMSVAPLPELIAGHGATYPPVSFRAAEVLGYIHPLDLIGAAPRFMTDDDQVVLGILLPILIVLSAIRGRRRAGRWLWLIGGVGFIILGMGPTLHPFDLPLPYRLLHVAMGGMYRAPARFMLPAIFTLIVFVAVSLEADYRRLNRVTHSVGLIAVLLMLAFENHWYEPFPTFTLPDYQIYHTIGADPGEYLVLEVPVGAHNTITDEFGRGSELEYYATIHGKRLINGQVSRAPAGTTHDYRQWILITALAEEGPIPAVDSARSELRRLSIDWDMRYIILHRDMISAGLANWAVPFFNTQPGWCLVDEEGPLLAYRRMDDGICPQPDLLKPPADGVIQIGDGGDDRYLGFGWYAAENVGGPQARWTGEVPTSTLRVKLMPQPYHVSLQATAYPENQRVAVEANGQRVAEFAIGAGWNEYRFELSADVINPAGLTTLNFIPARVESAYEQTNRQVDDRRPLAIAVDAITFAPVSGKP